MVKRIENLVVVENKSLTKDYFILVLSCANKDISDIKPGQFVQVKVDKSHSTFLRRPFSVHDVDFSKNTISLLIKIVGNGTLALSGLKKNDTLNVIYPLGNSYSIPQPGKRILLAGGGCGKAPLLFLGKKLRSHGFIPDLLLGFKDVEQGLEIDEYNKIGRVYLATEDGSVGQKGYLTDHSILKSEKYDYVYSCGPEKMLKNIARYCKDRKIFCEVSLENLMACGIGACLCCVVDTVKGNLCTCTEGPVFNINDLKW